MSEITIAELQKQTVGKLLELHSDWSAGLKSYRAAAGNRKRRAAFDLQLGGDHALTVEIIGDNPSIGFDKSDFYPGELRILADAAEEMRNVNG